MFLPEGFSLPSASRTWRVGNVGYRTAVSATHAISVQSTPCRAKERELIHHRATIFTKSPNLIFKSRGASEGTLEKARA
jgi:hypothetical protein